MLKRGVVIVNIIVLAIFLTSPALADSKNTNSNQNAWLQAVQLQEQKQPPTTATTNLATLTQHIATVKQANQLSASATTVPAHERSVANIKVTNTTTTKRSQSAAIAANKNQLPIPAHLWNLQNVDILKVVAEVARETGKNFVVDPQVSGKVTIVSNKPLNSQEIYQVFLSTLQVLGYGAVPRGNVIKIVPLRDASREANDSTPSKGDALMVEVIRLRYVSAVQLVPILNPLIPTWASVSAVTTSNNLIISGTAAVVNRIIRIINRVDVPEANGVDVIALQYANASDVSNELNKLIQSARAYGDTVNAAVSADDRSNSIMLSGNESDRLRLKVLISELDQGGGTNGSGDTQVIHLHYIQVQDILPILRGIAHQNSSASGLMMANSATSNNSSGPTFGSNGSSGGSDSSFTNQVQTITNAQLNSGAVTGDGSKQQVIITGDITNNALIITAPAAMMHQLKNVITHLDIRPEQVLVQGIIAEVDAGEANNLGIQWGTNALSGSDSTGNSVLGPTSPFAATGGMGVGFIKNGNLRGLIELLSSDSNSNILSTPSITVLNNGHADIEVGKTISETTGQYQPTSAANNNPFVQYQDKSIGLTLQVSPQITGDDSIRLAIDQTNSSIITDSTSSNSPNPATNQEKISTSVLVDNGQILVLGGLINAQKQTVTTQVPILGDIPVVGWLFKHTKDENVKKDLLVFLRPIVITNSAQATALSQSRYDFIRDREILTGHGLSTFTASSTLMSANEIQLPVPFTAPGG